MRVATLQMYTRSLSHVLDNQTQIAKLQIQMGSGKKINTASDDPVRLSQAFHLSQSLDHLQQYQSNNQSAQTWLSFEEESINHAQEILQRIYVLAVSANKTSLDPPDRMAIATEIDTRLEELLHVANQRLPTGEYVFGGHQTHTPPVKVLTPTGFQYRGDSGQIALQIGASVSVAVQDPGDRVFFQIPASHYNPQVVLGSAQVTGSASAFPTGSGTLSPLASGDLILNGYAVRQAVVTDDRVSTTDRAASAPAIAAAINAGVADHHVSASVQPTACNLGVYTPGSALSGVQLQINGYAIDTAGDTTESGLLSAINALTENTGVVAANSGGSIVLTAADGRNIQVQTDGTSATATFANLALNGGASLDQVQRAAIQLHSMAPIQIGGGAPARAGLTAGTVALSQVPAGLAVSDIKMVQQPTETHHAYRLVFHNPPTTFSVVSDADPSVYYTGPDPHATGLGDTVTYDGVSEASVYTSGMTILVNGVEYTLTGNPAAGDTVTMGVVPETYQDLFTTIQNLSSGLRMAETPTELDYQVGIAISNIQSARDTLAAVQADVGARLNVLSGEFALNEDFHFSTTTALIQIQYLDTADYEDIISKFQMYTLTLEIAQKTFVTMQQLSLFRYL